MGLLHKLLNDAALLLPVFLHQFMFSSIQILDLCKKIFSYFASAVLSFYFHVLVVVCGGFVVYRRW